MLQFKSVTKKYKNHTVIKDVSFTVKKGQLVALIGESGCGKTTLLKMINRLVEPSFGSIFIDDKNIDQMDIIHLRRNMGYVIQQTGLFPHLTVRENIEIIPRVNKMSPEEIYNNTIRLMKMVGLDTIQYLDRYPTELSGGQQQRVGVARAFATNPDIILMDEPFSALDPITRSDLQDELISIQAKLKKTIIFVTHDMDEAIKIADMICIMRNGGILQYDTPENVLKNPADNYVSGFVGKNRIWSSPEFIKTSDIMYDNPVTCFPSLPISKCIDKMRERKVDSLMVIQEGGNHLLGIAGLKAVATATDKTAAVETVMQNEYPKLSPDDTIVDALKAVTENHTSTVPVVDQSNNLKGLITRSNLVTALSRQYMEVEGV